MHAVLVVNPVSGKQHGERLAERTEQALRAAGHQCSRIQGDDGPHSREQLTKALETGCDTVVVVGGDGAVHHLLPVLSESRIPLGLVPAGTGNDTARALGLPLKDPAAAIGILLAGHTRDVDLARTDAAHVVTVVASGFDSKVNERANAMRWPRGHQRYNLAILAELRDFQPLPFTLTLDGVRLEREAMLVAVGNGPSFGGGLRIADGASLDDGLLDVCVINPVSKTRLVRVFPRLYRGTHVTLPEFERHHVREVTVECPGIVAYGDGERLGPLPLTARVIPGAFRVIVP